MSKVKDPIDSKLLALRWGLIALSISLGGAGLLFFGFFALIGLVTFNVVYVVILAPMLYAFWLLIRWGISKHAMRAKPAFYAKASPGLRALMAAFLLGLARILIDMARLHEGADISQIDGAHALIFLLVGAIIGAGGALYNNRQHQRRLHAG